MGKKFDALFGRSFKTAKFKGTINLAVSRLTVLRNQRQARCSVARSDVVQLLTLGQHERALLRVEHVVKEQNMLDVYVLIEGFCHLLIERVNLIEQEKNCPEELREAMSSLIYASTRCGDFPELQEIRALFASRFGKEFVGRAVELRNNCGVNPKMIQKLSTRMPSSENKMKVIKEIASEENIVLQLEEVASEKPEGKSHTASHTGDFRMGGVGAGVGAWLPVVGELEKVEGFSDSMEMRKKYKDVADAAQAAFESAAYAAAAARAAVELSRSDSQDPDDPNNPKLQPSAHLSAKFKPHTGEENDLRGIEEQKVGTVFEKIHPTQNNSSESEDEGVPAHDKAEKLKQRKKEPEFRKSPSSSSIESLDNPGNEMNIPLGEDLLMKLTERELVFDESEDESRGETKMPYSPSYEHFPLRSQAGLVSEKVPETKSNFTEKIGTPGAYPFNKDKRPISARTRKTFGR